MPTPSAHATWQPASGLALLLGGMAGLAALQFLPRLLVPAEQGLLALLALGLTGLAWRWRRVAGAGGGVVGRAGGKLAVLAALGLALGLLWAQQRAAARLADALAPAHIAQPVEVLAVVDGLPQALQGHGGLAGWRLALR